MIEANRFPIAIGMACLALVAEAALVTLTLIVFLVASDAFH